MAGYPPSQQYPPPGAQQYPPPGAYPAAYQQPGYPAPSPAYPPGYAAQPYYPPVNQAGQYPGQNPPYQPSQNYTYPDPQKPVAGYVVPPPAVPQASGAGPSALHLVGQAAATTGVFDPTGKYKLVMQGAFVAVEVAITQQEGFKAEGGAMVAMSTNVDLTAKLDGGIGAACCRSCCAGESGFFTYFHLKEGTRGDVLISPCVPGEITLLHLKGEEWRIQKGSFLVADDTITIGTAVQSFAKGCCSGEGFFILRASGVGRCLINSYGSIIRYDLQPGEVRKIDNGFLVAWTAAMPYTINLATKSIFASVISGEAIVATFTGPGTVYVQTRSVSKLALTVAPYIPVVQQNQNGGGDLAAALS